MKLVGIRSYARVRAKSPHRVTWKVSPSPQPPSVTPNSEKRDSTLFREPLLRPADRHGRNAIPDVSCITSPRDNICPANATFVCTSRAARRLLELRCASGAGCHGTRPTALLPQQWQASSLHVLRDAICWRCLSGFSRQFPAVPLPLAGNRHHRLHCRRRQGCFLA